MVSTKPALAQFISLFTTEKKSSFDRQNYTSIQVFLFKISEKKENVVKKFVLKEKLHFVNFSVNEFKIHEYGA